MVDIVNFVSRCFLAIVRNRLFHKLLVSILCVTLIVVLTKGKPMDSHGMSEVAAKSVRLHVDKANGARVFCAGTPAVVSLAGSFEFFERNLTGGRKHAFEGPWRGNLAGSFLKITDDHYVLSASDAKSGVSYSINYIQKTRDVIALALSFTAPQQPLHLTFDLMKLYGDLFQGATLLNAPHKMFDPKVLPTEPRPFDDRVLLKNKNKVTLNAPLCGVEITDNSNSLSINLADFRNVPWDTKKSFYLWVDGGRLSPGKRYDYSYTIRFLAPTQSNIMQAGAAAGRVIERPDPWSFLKINPKEQKIKQGYFSILSTDSIMDRVSGGAGATLVREIELRTGMSLARQKRVESARGCRISIEIAPKSRNIPAEGFEIRIDEGGIVISGADERGCLYGVYALMGELRQENDTWIIAAQSMKDWPDLPVRSIEIEMLKPAIRDVNLFKRYIDAFSRARVNTIIFAHEPRQVSAWKKGKDGGWWTKRQISEVAAYAKELGMDVWAGMINKFEPLDFPELNLIKGTNIYDPNKQSSYAYLFSLYEEILNAYNPSSFLIGHDEIKGLSLYSTEPAALLAKSINTIHAWLSARGIKTVIFGDMLLEKGKWNSLVGSANSMNPSYNSGPTHLAIDKIAKDIKIIDWHYSNRPNYQSLKYFREHGFTVMGASWHDPVAAKNLVGSVKSYGAQGAVGMDYGFWSTLSSSATTLYAPLCGWSSDCLIPGNDEDVFALATMMQEDIIGRAKRRQTITILDIASNKSTFDRISGDDKGIFDLGPFVDLRGLVEGRQVFGGVPFSVTSSGKGSKNNCVVTGVTRSGVTDSALCLPVSSQSVSADVLAFLHTCHIDEPSYIPNKIGNYIVEYENGKNSSIDIVEGFNITDVRSSQGLRRNIWKFSRSPEALIGSRLVWRGKSTTGVPLNLQMLLWKNPYPALKIKRIRLCSKKTKVTNRIALLGVTAIRFD